MSEAVRNTDSFSIYLLQPEASATNAFDGVGSSRRRLCAPEAAAISNVKLFRNKKKQW
jgi:hypothetical protein